MAQTYFIFNFGTAEDVAQQARHRLDSWRQAFHLTNKLEYKLEREPGKKEDAPEHLKLIVRLDFSDHEKLSYQRWLDRIPTEAPFKEASPKVVRPGDADFAATASVFEGLDQERRSAEHPARNR
jgi:hypothetical protein